MNRGQEDAANKNDSKCSVKTSDSRFDSVLSTHVEKEFWNVVRRLWRYVRKRNKISTKNATWSKNVKTEFTEFKITCTVRIGNGDNF